MTKEEKIMTTDDVIQPVSDTEMRACLVRAKYDLYESINKNLKCLLAVEGQIQELDLEIHAKYQEYFERNNGISRKTENSSDVS